MRRRKSWSELSARQRRIVVTGAVIQAALQLAALRDLRRRTASEVNGPRWAWAAATLVNTIGPLAYFVFGRRGAATALPDATTAREQ